ncbi:MAG TPA: hypothetical protein VFV23_13390 [Verrucomicrobiae bacterium]|nr:hypothetical protein [Verrucomicrobiae bacterium]
MKEFLAFLLPVAVAFAGTRIVRLILGKKFEENFGIGLRFTLGLAVGMVVFSQSVLLAAIAGIDLSGALAWAAMIWGIVEVILLAPKAVAGAKQIQFHSAHLWLLLLLPVIYAAWVFGKLSTLEGTLEFDANAFWVFKAKILYLEHGKNLFTTIHQSNLGYTHMDYPMLVPGIYTLGYGLAGGVDEFINKVWPFWMMVALSIAVISLSRIWKRPRPLPLLIVNLLCFLPATLQFVRNEGGTIPMVYGTSLAAMLFVVAIANADQFAIAAGILSLIMCATTKFEGVIYAALWGGITMILCWRRGWLKSSLIWKPIAVAAICLVPYLCFRLEKPILHPESNWAHEGIRSPATVAHRFPQTLLLDVGCRFFDKEFFKWQTPDKEHLQFVGHWNGFKSLANPELSALPWLLLVFIGFSLWKKSRERFALVVLLAVIFGELAFLSFVISCLARMQADVAQVIDFGTNVVGRYYYPFFVACFLGTALIWTHQQISVSVSKPAPIEKAPVPPGKPAARKKQS